MSETRPDADSNNSAWSADLELLAIEEQFVAEHAAGRAPRLSAYLQRYPEHAEALTVFVATYLTPTGETAEGAEDETETQRPLSAGTQRALDEIFGTREDERRVAERRVSYSTDVDKDATE